VVSPAVLIPRPETEHLVETVLELARAMERPKIVDVGTGSGCIALALAHELKNAEVYAVDISGEALEIARANAARLQLEGRVQFAQCNVLEPMRRGELIGVPRLGPNRPNERQSGARRGPRSSSLGMTTQFGTSVGRFEDFDFVVSNPPYVGFDEADKVQQSVRDFEPRVAVFAGEQGLDVIAPLVRQAWAALQRGGWLVVEIGYSMQDAVLDLLDPTMWESVRVVADLQGIPRVVAARKARGST